MCYAGLPGMPALSPPNVVSVRGEVFFAENMLRQSAVLVQPAFDDIDVVGLVEFRTGSFQHDHAPRTE